MNYNLRRMREPDVYLETPLADFEVLDGGIRHWIDWDGAHYFAEDEGAPPEDGSVYNGPVVRIGADGYIWANSHGLHMRWLARRGQDKRLTYTDPQGGQSLFPLALILNHETAITPDETATAKAYLKKFTAELIDAGDFATLGLLAESFQVARQMLSETSQDTSRAIQRAVESAGRECGGLPSQDATWRHFAQAITRKGFDKALTTSGFGWLPRSSSITLELR